ncbi:MAG: beta-N-acetylhexosaminidase [Prolixibacteraceae bacterium]|nr:beta-N-acetylhexosaminidase [Prolixibacteraceae bacterium]
MKTRKKSIIGLVILTAVLFFSSCENEPPTDLTLTPFIPLPVSIEATGGEFEITVKTVVYATEGLEVTAQILASQIAEKTGIMPEVEISATAPRKGIYISGSGENGEGYELKIGKKLVTITGSPTGCFFGVQTLLQAINTEDEEGEKDFEIATGIIKDKPYYEYRGAMLDVARHFFNVEEVKQFIDFLAMYKMNVLHLHLSDDQGWRIEIKSWPNLTTHGGSLEVGGGPGGFYTQEQFKELVQYAADRQITIIPEIDMPGHTNAALASYAELNCNGKATELYTGTRVGFSTLCTDKDVTYQFIDDVVREISVLIPGKYFHMGGDESHSTPLEDYIPFVEKVQKIIKSHGKEVIGWDEIANSAIVEGTVVQFWADEANTTMGIAKGAKVIMSPAKKAYLDMKYNADTELGLRWAGLIEVDTGYDWDPETLSDSISRENILGIEAALWSETVTNIDEVEYMVFPRLPGYAEIGWTAPDKRNWDEYKTRLATYGKVFEAMGIDYYKSPLVPWEE